MYDYDEYRNVMNMQNVPGVMGAQSLPEMLNAPNIPGMYNMPSAAGVSNMPNAAGMPNMMPSVAGAMNIPNMYMAGMPQYYYPMLTMPSEQMESMYPKVYHMVNEKVNKYCDNMDLKYGPSYMPTKDEMDSMVEDIQKDIAPKVEQMAEYSEAKEEAERQLGFGGRRLLRDIIAILFIRELLRRRRPHFGSHGFGY